MCILHTKKSEYEIIQIIPRLLLFSRNQFLLFQDKHCICLSQYDVIKQSEVIRGIKTKGDYAEVYLYYGESNVISF